MERKKKGENSYGKIFHILNLINRGDAIRGRKYNRGDAAGGMEYQEEKNVKYTKSLGIKGDNIFHMIYNRKVSGAFAGTF